MFSLVFPDKVLRYWNGKIFKSYNLVKDLFKKADESLGISLSKIILEGPKDELDPTKYSTGNFSYKLLNFSSDEKRIQH